MLLDAATWRLAFRIDDVLAVLPRELPGSVSAERPRSLRASATRRSTRRCASWPAASRTGWRRNWSTPAAAAGALILDVVEELLAACAPHAEALGCAGALRGVAELARCPGYGRQRALAADGTGRGGAALAPVTRGLADGFARKAAGLVASV